MHGASVSGQNQDILDLLEYDFRHVEKSRSSLAHSRRTNRNTRSKIMVDQFVGE